jgi:hypothetical protein
MEISLNMLAGSVERLIPQHLQLEAQVTVRADADVTSRKSLGIRVWVDQCVSIIRLMEAPLFFCLRTSCNHRNEIGEQ